MMSQHTETVGPRGTLALQVESRAPAGVAHSSDIMLVVRWLTVPLCMPLQALPLASHDLVSPLILSDPAMWWVDGSSLLLIRTNSVTGSEEVVLWSLASSSVVRVRPLAAGMGRACHGLQQRHVERCWRRWPILQPAFVSATTTTTFKQSAIWPLQGPCTSAACKVGSDNCLLTRRNYSREPCLPAALQVLYGEDFGCKLHLPMSRFYNGEAHDRVLLTRECPTSSEVLVIKLADVAAGGCCCDHSGSLRAQSRRG